MTHATGTAGMREQREELEQCGKQDNRAMMRSNAKANIGFGDSMACRGFDAVLR